MNSLSIIRQSTLASILPPYGTQKQTSGFSSCAPILSFSCVFRLLKLPLQVGSGSGLRSCSCLLFLFFRTSKMVYEFNTSARARVCKHLPPSLPRACYCFCSVLPSRQLSSRAPFTTVQRCKRARGN